MTPVQFFNDDDDGYQRWLADHPNGYVVNTSRTISPTYMVLHRATCRSISEYKPQHAPGAFTERDFVKACADTVVDLRRWVRGHGRPDGSFTSDTCPQCKP